MLCGKTPCFPSCSVCGNPQCGSFWRQFGDIAKLGSPTTTTLPWPLPPNPNKTASAPEPPPEVCETLCHAAALTGATVNQFLVQSALKEADAVIEREQILRLTRRDSEMLLDLLENPPQPNARFDAAMTHYRKVKRADADSSFEWQP